MRVDPGPAEYGSDVVVDLLRAFGVEYAALNPGATFRGLHDSLVNYGGNRDPELILCCHEEIAVSLAHGYAKARGRPMAAIVHDVVGLQHASMAIYNAFCDRAPVLVLGATGPMDTTQRRPWTDWVHTALVQGNLVRDYVKWDDQPASVAAVPEAFTRAWRIATTEPAGPVYLCLDAALQETRLGGPVATPDPSRFAPPAPPQAEPAALEEAARLLAEAESPLIVSEWLPREPAAHAALLRLSTLLAAPVVDMGDGRHGRPGLPSRHPLDLSGARAEAVRGADVVLALDVQNLLGALGEVDRATRQVTLAGGGRKTVIGISLHDYAVRSWAQTCLALVPVDLPIAAHSGVALPALVALVEQRLAKDRRGEARAARAARVRARHDAIEAGWRAAVESERAERPVALSVLAAEVWQVIKDEDWVLANGTAGGWARRLWDWRPERVFGGSGGGGVGYGPGAALGVTLAFRGTGKVCVDLQSDGDLLFATSALYTAAHHRLPLLVVTCNNRSYYNDEEHQGLIARARGRPVENAGIGTRLDDPAPDLAAIARGFGLHAEGPVEEPATLAPALRRALRIAKEEGRPALVDVVTQPR